MELTLDSPRRSWPCCSGLLWDWLRRVWRPSLADCRPTLPLPDSRSAAPAILNIPQRHFERFILYMCIVEWRVCGCCVLYHGLKESMVLASHLVKLVNTTTPCDLQNISKKSMRIHTYKSRQYKSCLDLRGLFGERFAPLPPEKSLNFTNANSLCPERDIV